MNNFNIFLLKKGYAINMVLFIASIVGFIRGFLTEPKYRGYNVQNGNVLWALDFILLVVAYILLSKFNLLIKHA